MSTKGISAAKLATAQMEELLQPALEDLRRALEISQRTGVYEDVGAVRAAMTRLKLAIDQAMRIARRAGWPLSPADRRHIVQSLSAGIAQRERRASLPEMAVSNPPPRSIFRPRRSLHSAGSASRADRPRRKCRSGIGPQSAAAPADGK